MEPPLELGPLLSDGPKPEYSIPNLYRTHHLRDELLGYSSEDSATVDWGYVDWGSAPQSASDASPLGRQSSKRPSSPVYHKDPYLSSHLLSHIEVSHRGHLAVWRVEEVLMFPPSSTRIHRLVLLRPLVFVIPVDGLDMFPKGGRVRVALLTAADHTHVGLLVRVGPVLVLGSVTGIAEGLHAAGELAMVGLLPRVGADVGLEVLQPTVGLVTAVVLKRDTVEREGEDTYGTAVGLLARMAANMDDEHVTGSEWLRPLTALNIFPCIPIDIFSPSTGSTRHVPIVPCAYPEHDPPGPATGAHAPYENAGLAPESPARYREPAEHRGGEEEGISLAIEQGRRELTERVEKVWPHSPHLHS